MLELALRYGAGLTTSQEIASRQGIPVAYLDQLLTTLGKAGLVRSVRGPQGGHMLARPPDQITISEVISALEGPIAPVSCVTDSGFCHLTGTCVLQDVWLKVEEVTQGVLASVTLEELAKRQRAQASSPMYYI